MWLAHRLFPSVRRLQARVKELEAENLWLNPPIPPLDLRIRVAGRPEEDCFSAIGHRLYWDIQEMLIVVDRKLEEFLSVLDLGCGTGRVTRYFNPKVHGSIVGADIDREAIEWCNRNLRSIAQFDLTDPMPPLPYADGSFDLVVCISVFTHLPADIGSMWRREVHRVLAPGGIGIVTFQGPSCFPPAAASAIAESGFYYETGHDLPGLPSFYQTCYHTPERVQQEWSDSFEILTYRERVINNHQDALVCMKPSRI